jgi:hypothetical protein
MSEGLLVFSLDEFWPLYSPPRGKVVMVAEEVFEHTCIAPKNEQKQSLSIPRRNAALRYRERCNMNCVPAYLPDNTLKPR